MTDERLRELYESAVDARTSGTRAECPDPERLLALARREGSEDERLRTLDHAMSCGECMRELALLRAIEQAGAGGLGSRATAPRAASFSWRRAVPLALAASVVLAVGISLRQRTTDVRSDDVERGGGPASLVVHGASDLTVRQGDTLTFAWRPIPGASRYLVEVLDDAGRAVMTQPSSDTLLVLRDLAALTPGREYRWWVRTDDAGAGQARSALGRLRIAAP
jgi:hypothetical protein